MPAMTPQELQAFLAQPLVASFCTLGADGAPRVAPVWFQYQDGRFYVWTDNASVKLRNVLRDPRVALCIASHDEPYRYVVARGVAEVVRDGVAARAVAIAQRYYGPERGTAYGGQAADGGSSIIVVTPHALLTESDA